MKRLGKNTNLGTHLIILACILGFAVSKANASSPNVAGDSVSIYRGQDKGDQYKPFDPGEIVIFPPIPDYGSKELWLTNNRLPFGYAVDPDLETSSDKPTISPKVSLNVAETGAATVSIPIEMPMGVGGMMPSVALSYNSMADNGVAGYGCNISGTSAITTGMKSIYYDGKAKGLTHSLQDALFLDGKRLILSSGTEGMAGAVYTTEDDPFTTVTISNPSSRTYFIVKTNDGKTLRYGETDESCLSYMLNGSSQRVKAWYLSSMDDPLGNRIEYSYKKDGNVVYPNTIYYGKNRNTDNGLLNKVSFFYKKRADVRRFMLGDSKCSMELLLDSIATSTNDLLYRGYKLSYDSFDQTDLPYSRLKSITISNGNGVKLKPVTFWWHGLSSFKPNVIKPNNGIRDYDVLSRILSNGDLNGDGISDVVDIRCEANAIGAGSYDVVNYCYVLTSSVDVNGNVSFNEGWNCRLPDGNAVPDTYEERGAPMACDMDGDGLCDVVIPIFHRGTDKKISYVEFALILGNDVKSGVERFVQMKYVPVKATRLPLFTCADIDLDGKSELIVIENEKKDVAYNGGILRFISDRQTEINTFLLNDVKNSKPKDFFISDYNGDGLPDLMLNTDKIQSVFFNSGNEKPFSPISSLTFEENMKNFKRLTVGDFNGDGVSDLVAYDTERKVFVVGLSKGDGGFNFNRNISVTGFNAGDTERLRLMPYDIDRDGITDLVASTYYKGKTYTYWMRCNGTSFSIKRTASSKRKDDSNPAYFLLGDFSGDGYADLANYGYDCFWDKDADTDPELNVYVANPSADAGKMTSVSDGFGSYSRISYKSMSASGGIYTPANGTKEEKAAGISDFVLPIALVAEVESCNGAAGDGKYASKSLHTSYKYGGLKVNLKGKGLLGFSSFRSECKELGALEEKTVTEWSREHLIPPQISIDKTVGNSHMSTERTLSVTDKGKRCFFLSSTKEKSTDFDGNTTVTTNKVDETNGQPLTSTTEYGVGMYKKTTYSGYARINGMWLPKKIMSAQKHKDNASEFVANATYEYDERGLRSAVTTLAGTQKAVRTEYKYDVFGNVLSSTARGEGIMPITNINEYDKTGRFVIKKRTEPSSAVNEFVYSPFGELLTEKDCTNPANVLSTAHRYNGWGVETMSISPAGDSIRTYTGWGNNNVKHHFTVTAGRRKPWVKTWYDCLGREIQKESIGAKNIRTKELTEYDIKGNPTRKTTTTGDLITTVDMAYDDRGRIVSETYSTGRTVTYQYGNRKVTVTDGGRKSTKEYDAWENLSKAADAAGTVVYKYTSQGLPCEASAFGSTVRMEYDEAGNRIRIEDPDAGTITSTYDAAGRLVEQTDGRGKTTRNTYDALGRLASSDIDGVTLEYEYGTSGNDAMRLLRKSYGAENAVRYEYDGYGRVSKETREIGLTGESPSYGYEYDAQGNITSKTYPGGFSVRTKYDSYGNAVQRTLGNDTIWRLETCTGRNVAASALGGKITSVSTLDGKGFPAQLLLTKGDDVLRKLELAYDPVTSNLKSKRDSVVKLNQSYTYDNLDRLVRSNDNAEAHSKDVLPSVFSSDPIGSRPPGSTEMIKAGEEQYGIYNVNYLDNGNISYKTLAGNYSYDDGRPHAVTSVENEKHNYLQDKAVQTIDYNGLGKVEEITDGQYGMSFAYGPDGDRFSTLLYKDGKEIRRTLYLGDSEVVDEDVAGNGNYVRRIFHYLGDGVICLTEEGKEPRLLYAFYDNLGSVLEIVDADGNPVFRAKYDAWGRQTVIQNTVGYNRGYTGHEMMPEFGLINMNGRLYDPLLGRFLSPDNYVQMPDNSQNFNRYSYCLNNPLKYNDPSGELSAFTVLFNVFNTFMYVYSKMEGFYYTKPSIDIPTDILTSSVGGLLGHEVGSWGKELLRGGLHGLATGISDYSHGEDFGIGFFTGFASSVVGSEVKSLGANAFWVASSAALAGGLTSWQLGGDFLHGMRSGFDIGLLNHLGDGIIRHDQYGNMYGVIPEVVVTAPKSNYHKVSDFLSGLSGLLHVADEVNKYAGNVRKGSNGKLYFPKDNRVFYGNQYVTTAPINNLDRLNLKKISEFASTASDATRLWKAYENDGHNIGINTQREIAGITARRSGEFLGTLAGRYIGAGVGGTLGGFLALPTSYGLGLAGNYFGGILGEKFGIWYFNTYMR